MLRQRRHVDGEDEDQFAKQPLLNRNNNRADDKSGKNDDKDDKDDNNDDNYHEDDYDDDYYDEDDDDGVDLATDSPYAKLQHDHLLQRRRHDIDRIIRKKDNDLFDSILFKILLFALFLCIVYVFFLIFLDPKFVKTVSTIIHDVFTGKGIRSFKPHNRR
jgi:hypothetical protein